MNDTLTNRPDPVPGILAQLETDYGYLIKAVDDYDVEASAMPATVRDEDTRHRFAEAISRMQKTTKSIENARTAEKAPFLASERAVDGFFMALNRRLGDVVDDLNACLTKYLNVLREQERARQEAAAAEARRQARLAQEEAQAAQEKAQAEERASARRRAAEEASRKEQEADRHTVAAMAAEQAAQAKPAEVVRGRSDSGKLSTLRTTWVGEILDLDELDVERLKPFIAKQHLEQALRAYVRAGHRELRGAAIYETSSAQVRG